jgi:predicted P-loop ATPase
MRAEGELDPVWAAAQALVEDCAPASLAQAQMHWIRAETYCIGQWPQEIFGLVALRQSKIAHTAELGKNKRAHTRSAKSFTLSLVVAPSSFLQYFRSEMSPADHIGLLNAYLTSLLFAAPKDGACAYLGLRTPPAQA